MKSVEEAAKFLLDILDGTSERIGSEVKFAEIDDEISELNDCVNDILAKLDSDEVKNDLEEVFKLGIQAAIIEKQIRSLKNEKERTQTYLTESLAKRAFITPEKRKELEKDFVEYITERMKKFDGQCVYMATDENGVAHYELGVFFYQHGINNDGFENSLLPHNVEMWITSNDVDVRLDGYGNGIRIYDAKRDKEAMRDEKN